VKRPVIARYPVILAMDQAEVYILGMKTRHIWIACVLICAISSALGQARTISASEAKSLVRVVLKHDRIKIASRYCSLEQIDKPGKRFIEGSYSFDARCDFTNAFATTVYGLYVVSERTGDVWNFNGCEWFDFPQLHHLQRDIMRRLRTNAAERAKYRKETGCAESK